MKDKKSVKKAAPAKKAVLKKVVKAPAKKPVSVKKSAAKPAPASKKDVYAEDVRRLEAGIAELTGKVKSLEKRLNDYAKKAETPAITPIVPPTPAKTMFDTIDFSAPTKGLGDAAKVADKTPPVKIGGVSPIIRACAAVRESKFGPAAAQSPFARR